MKAKRNNFWRNLIIGFVLLFPWGIAIAVVIALFAGCHHSQRFDWNNYCSAVKECKDPDQWCFIDIGPDGEPYEYGQCLDYGD
jgi:hypothetical protein